MDKGPLPLSVHAAMEPLLAIVLIASPWIFGFDGNDDASAATIVIGAIVLSSGLMTSWRLSLVNLIDIRTHMLVDIGVALALILAPFALAFSDDGSATRFFLIAGVLEAIAVFATRWEPEAKARPGAG